MKSETAPLTDLDRRLEAQLEALYGPVRKPAPPEPEPVRPAARRRSLAVPLLRTIVLVAIAYVLVAWTEPGRAMYQAITDGARIALEALMSGSLFR